LCEACANQKGAQVESHFGLTDLLSGLADVGKNPEVEEEVVSKTCPGCGMSYEDFRRVGRLGCAECYEVFYPAMKEIIRRIHGTAVHAGPEPARGHRGANARKVRRSVPPAHWT